MKKLIFLLISLLPALATWAEVGDEFTTYRLTFKVTSEVPKTVELICPDDENLTNFIGSLTIPASVNGYSVTSIGEFAFLGCTSLTSIKIPNSVTSIGDGAFVGCSGLTSIEIPNSVTSIGAYAFLDCSGLTSIEIPNSVTSIAYDLFCDCSNLTDVFCYAESVPKTDDDAFLSMDMDNVTLHVPAASINAYMETKPWSDFGKIVALGDDPVIAGDNYIDGIYYSFDEEMLTAEVIRGENEYKGDVIILESVEYGGSTYVVTSIGENAFNNCKHLITVTIPQSVTRIGDQAFSSCKGLSDVFCYAEDVPDMLSDAFYDSTAKFKTLHVPDASVELYADDAQWSTFGTIVPLSVESPVRVMVGDIYYLLNGEEQTAVVTRGPDSYEGDVDIPANVTYDGVTYSVIEIGNWAFNDCSDLISVSIPDGVTKIGYRAFWGCNSLFCVDIPMSVTSIGDEAFSECGNVDLTIPDNVTSIGEFAFYNCYNLTSANLPKGLTEVNAFIFYGCKSLTSVVIPEGITFIGTYAFARCDGLTSVVIPEGVTTIDVEAFSMCSRLSSVTIPEGVEEIRTWGFASCWSLTSVTLPSSLKYLSYGVFSGCGNLTDIYCYAEEVPTTGDYVFFNLPDATLHVPASAIDAYMETEPWSNFETIVGDLDAFFVVGNLRYRITSNGGNMARGFETNRAANASLNTVELVGYVTMPTDAVEIPAVVSYNGEEYAVTSIGANAFIHCSSMTSVTIPSSVTNIEDGAFEGCTGLTDVYCNADPAQLTWSSDAKSFMSDKETNFHVTDVAAWEASFADANVTFVADLIKGDVNGDGSLSITDVTMTISHILGQTPDGFDAAVADVNGDGSVTITDVTIMIDMILKQE
jgi:sorbitol-specific phosphotransferase system component IIA